MFFVDGNRIKITRVVDYYRASERLTKIADALKFGIEGSKRQAWLERTRKLLLEPGGHGRVMRSIAKMRELYDCKSAVRDQAVKAEKYLRGYKRFLNYATLNEQEYPIGSGVVESACKQIVSERMKLSGMRWHRDGAQHARLRLVCDSVLRAPERVRVDSRSKTMTSKPKLLNPNGKLLPDIEERLVLARKTKPLWAKLIEQPQSVETLEGTLNAEPGNYLCRGVRGENWPQKAEKLLEKHIPSGEVDIYGWERFAPKPDSSAVQAAQIHEPFRVVAQWGELTGNSGDYIVRSASDHSDV